MIIPMLAIAGNLAQKKYVPPIAGHISGDDSAVHGAADQRDSDCGRADVLPGAEPGTDSRTPADARGKDFLGVQDTMASQRKSIWDLESGSQRALWSSLLKLNPRNMMGIPSCSWSKSAA